MHSPDGLLSRRKFFARSGVLLGFAGVVAFGLGGGAGGAAPNGIEVEINNDFLSLDALYAAQGRPKVEALIANGSTSQACRTIQWIQVRNHTSMFDLICVSLGSADAEVQKCAFVLLGIVGARALKPHAQLIAAMRGQTKSRDFTRVIDGLLTDIEES